MRVGGEKQKKKNKKKKIKAVGFDEYTPLFIYAARVVVVGRRRSRRPGGRGGGRESPARERRSARGPRGTLHRYAFNSPGLSAIFVVVHPPPPPFFRSPLP